VQHGGGGEELWAIFSTEPVNFKTGLGVLSLDVRQQVRPVQVKRQWRVSTASYSYRLTRAADDTEIIAWQWHPSGHSPILEPHLHVSDGPLAKRHIPTGRVSIESVVRMLIRDLNAIPIKKSWEAILSKSEQAFREAKRHAGP